MTRRARPNPRPITELEASVLRAVLHLAEDRERARALLATVADLVVVSRCGCGCDTVEFRRAEHATVPDLLGAGWGTTPDGQGVGVHVFATENEITGLELFDLDDVPARLPDPATVRP